MKRTVDFLKDEKFEKEWIKKVPSNLYRDGDLLRPKYNPHHPLELETKKYIKDKHNINTSHINIGITEEDLRALDVRQHETTYKSLFSFYSITIVRLNYEVYEVLKSGLKRFVEFSDQEIDAGLRYRAEIRGYAKEYIGELDDNGEIKYTKKKVPTNEKKLNYAMSFMRKIAILVIEREFDLRFKNFKNCHDVESESWIYQLEEARNYKKDNSIKTPFIDILSINRGIDKKILVDKILKKHEEYVVNYASLLGKYHAIKSQFKTCDNMWDMNILYEDYLNICMPLVQAQKLGRVDENYNRLNGEIKYGTFGF